MTITCPYCYPDSDEEQEIIYETEYCYYIQKPSEQTVLEGSGLIVPKAHRETVFDLTEVEWNETGKLLVRAKKRVEELYQPQGYSIGWNSYKVGGQTVPHAHLHVIPRFEDEPYAGRGIRAWIKQKENLRPSLETK